MTHLPGTPSSAAQRRRAAALSTASALFGVCLLAMIFVAPGTAAVAAETDPPPTSPPDSTVVATPVIEKPAASALVGDEIPFSGTAEPDSGIDLYSDSGGQPLCSVITDKSGAWSCEVTLPSTPSVTVRAVQSVAGQSTETSVGISVLNAPTAGAAGSGTVSNGTIMGEGLAGATVTAVVGEVSCTATVDSTGTWFCALPIGLTSGSYQLTASQVAPWSGGRSSSSSRPSTLTIDVDAPAPPGVTIPADSIQASGATFSGDGEDGATVTLFAGPHSLCQAVVAGGRWSCTSAAIDAGTYDVSAIQQDVAGNISDESARVSVTFAGVPTPPAPTEQPTPSATQPPSNSTAIPSIPDGDPTAAAPQQPQAQQGTTTDAPPATASGGWPASTRFSAGMQPAFGTAGSIDWTLALGIGLAMVALLAVPARLLAGTLRGLRAAPEPRSEGAGRLTGRNRSRYQEYETAPELAWNTRVTGGFALIASATITVLSAPVTDEPAYLRLLVAAVLGIFVVNAVAVLVPRLLARSVFDVTVGIRLRPLFLLVSVGATILSRVLDLDPALVFGIVFGLGLSLTASRRALGRLAALQIGALLAVGTTAFLISGSIASAAGPGTAGAFLSEFVNTVALASLGGAAILLLPIADLPGRHILRWKPIVWLLLALAGFTLLAGVLSSALEGLGGGAGLILLALASLTFAAVCVAIWLWVKFVRAPAHDESSTPTT
ncbi:Ig-like domain-containing protein [Agreia bicolorata]|uniref:Ig-like domain-containing protein n=1 Tax=Agreia bicolorata TaxID=110935 RepID=UPI000AD9E7AF|nr:Ig-like domain-containing protein [Agreia bicolorata]